RDFHVTGVQTCALPISWGWGTHASGWMSGSPLVGREPAAAEPAPWERVTEGDVAGLDFNLPPDDGVVAPIEWPERADGFVEVQRSEERRVGKERTARWW